MEALFVDYDGTFKDDLNNNRILYPVVDFAKSGTFHQFVWDK